MNALVFIILRQYRNRIKSIFSKPLSAILTSFAVLCFLIGPIFSFLTQKGGITDPAVMELLIAGMQLFVGLLLINAFLSQQSGLFTAADANLLFSAPLGRRDILFYAAVQTVPASLLSALFLTFYFPFIVGKAMTPARFLLTVLIMALFVACIYLAYYYVYMMDIVRPGLRNRIKRCVWLFMLAVAILFVLLLALNDFDVGRTAKSFFTSPLYNAFPVFGWAKWGIAAAVTGHYLSDMLPALLLLSGTVALLAWLFFTSDADFFEQAQQDSVKLQKIMDDVKSGNMNASRGLKKVKKAEVHFRTGAAAIMSRQLLEMKKSGALLNLREFLMCLAYLAIGLIMGLDFTVVFVMMIFGILSLSTADSWNSEFRRPYIYLIPESSFRKLIFSVLPGLAKSVAAGVLLMILSGIAYGLTPADTVSNAATLVGYIMLFVFAGVFTYRILGKQTNAVVLMFLRMLLIVVAAIPSAVFLIVIVVVNGGNIGPTTAAAVTFSTNLLLSCLIAFFSRSLFERSELMN